LVTRLFDAGYFSSIAAVRVGLGSRLPPQFGQIRCNLSLAHLRQKVHSKVQMKASLDCGAMSQSHISQLGRSSSMLSLHHAIGDQRFNHGRVSQSRGVAKVFQFNFSTAENWREYEALCTQIREVGDVSMLINAIEKFDEGTGIVHE